MRRNFGLPFFISIGKDKNGNKISIFSEINQWMGNMYCDHQPINVIEEMTYNDLKYWNKWHEIIQKEYGKTIPKGKK